MTALEIYILMKKSYIPSELIRNFRMIKIHSSQDSLHLHIIVLFRSKIPKNTMMKDN